MSLGNNRDYTTRDRSARRAMAVTHERTRELAAAGMSPADASRTAYEELSRGDLRARLKSWVDPILEHKRKMRARRAGARGGPLMPAPEKRNALRWWRPIAGIQLSALEAEAVDWAIDGHNDAVADQSYHEDNPDDAEIAVGSDPREWPAGDLEDILYRLEIQAPEMSDDPDGIQWGRAGRRAGKKLRASRPDGDTLDNGFDAVEALFRAVSR